MTAALLAAAFFGHVPASAQINAPPPRAEIFMPPAEMHAEYSTRDQVRYVGVPAAAGEMRNGLAPNAPAAQAQAQALLPEGFVARPTNALRVGPANGNAANSIPEKVISLYAVDYRGIPLAKGSDILTVVSASGMLLTTRRRNIPAAVDGTQPRIQAGAASANALEDARRVAQTGGLSAETPQLQIWIDGRQQGRLAWDIVVRSASMTEPVAIEYWISALDGSILARENMIDNYYYGHVSGTIWQTSPIQPVETWQFPRVKITEPSLPTTNATYMGTFYYPGLWFGPPRTFTASLNGPYVAVHNAAGPDLTASSGFPTVGDISIKFNPASEEEFAQASAYYWVDYGHALIAATATATNVLDAGQLPVNVNIASTCNANFDGRALNFFHSGGGCVNMAYSDVVLHEFGHAVDAANGGRVDPGYSEGFGDALAMLGTGQSCVGREYKGPGTCIRDGTAVVYWPGAMKNPDPHVVGQPYGEFVWALLQNLRQVQQNVWDPSTLTVQLTFAAAAANPSSVPDAVMLTFIMDDDDGDLANCTPHFYQIASAAASRQLPYPNGGNYRLPTPIMACPRFLL